MRDAVAEAAAGKSVVARTLLQPARLAASPILHPFHGTKLPSGFETTRTRGRKTRGRIAPPDFRLRLDVGLAYATAYAHIHVAEGS